MAFDREAAKQAEHFILAMRPDVKIALVEEIPPLPEDPQLCHSLSIALTPLAISA